MAATIDRLTANIGGSGEGRHQIYASVILCTDLGANRDLGLAPTITQDDKDLSHRLPMRPSW